MRFVIYKNSILATLCSIFGAAFVAMAVMALISGELGVLPGLGVIAAGFALMALGDFISTKKAEKKRKKAQQAASCASASTVSAASSQPSASDAGYAAPGQIVNGSAVVAALFFLLATLLGVWSVLSPYNSYFDGLALVECSGFLLLAIGCFRMKRTQRANAFQLLGALLPALSCAYSVFNLLRAVCYADASAIPTVSLIMLAMPLFAFLLLLLFAFSARKPKGSSGVVGALWFLPSVCLAAYLVMQHEYNYNLNRLLNDFLEHPRWMPYPAMLALFRDIHVIVACFLTGLCFRRICRSSAAVPQPEAAFVQPERPYVPPVQPEMRYTAPEPEPAKPQNSAPKVCEEEVQKQIQAYKDLLECGLLTPEECERKIRELMQEYYGG